MNAQEFLNEKLEAIASRLLMQDKTKALEQVKAALKTFGVYWERYNITESNLKTLADLILAHNVGEVKDSDVQRRYYEKALRELQGGVK